MMTCKRASVLMGVVLFLRALHPPFFLAFLDPPWLVDGHHDTFCIFTFFCLFLYLSTVLHFKHISTPCSRFFSISVLFFTLMNTSRKLAALESVHGGSLASHGLLEACEKQWNGRSNVGLVSFIYFSLFYNAAPRHLVPYSRDQYYYFLQTWARENYE